MAAFLEDLTPFYGTGERNREGQTLEKFLEDYDAKKYDTPSVTTDAVIFAYEKEEDLMRRNPVVKVLLVKRGNHPSIGYWALPGGFANLRENLEETARRELEEETGVQGLPMEQIATYGNVNRDPRTRVITTAYMSLVPEQDVKVQAGDDADDATWCQLEVQTERREESGEILSLQIRQPDKKLDSVSKVRHTVVGELIQEEKYEVEEGGMIAVDHAAIIVQAYEILRKRILKFIP